VVLGVAEEVDDVAVAREDIGDDPGVLVDRDEFFGILRVIVLVAGKNLRPELGTALECVCRAVKVGDDGENALGNLFGQLSPSSIVFILGGEGSN
jgi:hypothetical protein